MSSNGKTAELTLTVVNKVIDAESIKLDKTESNLIIGNSLILHASSTPKNITNNTLIWESSNDGVTTVDNNGKVTAIAPGDVIISVYTENNLKAECKIFVTLEKKTVLEVKETNYQ